MSLIRQKKGDKGDIKTYRPIRVASAVYRIGMQIIKSRMKLLIVGNDVLGGLQDGFRKGVTIEVNLLTLADCTEMAEKCSISFWVRYSNIKRYYYNIN